MELKKYQQRTLAVVKAYFEACQAKSPEEAYAEVAGATEIRLRLGTDYGYTNPLGMESTPTVCIKVPTGGGKTILAAHTLKLIATAQAKECPFVIWFAPSDTIRRQTAEALKKHSHPYRRELDAQFGGRVKVFDIDEKFVISPDDIERNLCIVVSTTQAFVHADTNKYKVYSHHEDMERHFGALGLEPGMEPQDGDPSRPKYSFANLLRHIRPVVIVDEAHHMVSDLSTKALSRLSPAAVLGLTATPDKNNNAVYSVSAEELFNEEMVKLPIELTEYQANWEDAVAAAIAKRTALAKIAATEVAEGSGAYLRPIVLFQATSVKGNVPVGKLKSHLVDTLKIPAGEIKVATGDQKELDDVDVVDPRCAVNYVITVEALKEGWDCPFAYVFCSLANVGNSKDTVQLLGRVMRMPYAKRRKSRELNRAYAFVMSASFGAAAADLTEGLKKKGFTGQEAKQVIETKVVEQSLGPLFDVPGDVVPLTKDQLDSLVLPDDGGITVSDLATGDGKILLTGNENEQAIDSVAAQLAEKGAVEVARELKAKYVCKKAQTKHDFAARHKTLKLPCLKSEVNGENLFSTNDSYDALGGSVAAELPSALAADEIGIAAGDGKMFVLKLEGSEIRNRFVADANQMMLHGFTGDVSAGDVVNVLDAITKDWPALLQVEKRHWLNVIVNDLAANHGMSYEQMVLAKYQIKQRLDYHYASTVRVVRKKAYQQVFIFAETTNIGLDLENGFVFDEHVYDGLLKTYHGIFEFSKHFLGPHRVPAFDGTGVGEEFECAKQIDSHPQVDCWLRNIANHPRSFRLPIATEKSDWFYPDFVGQLKDGRMFVFEYKGDMTAQLRETSEKDAIGKLWAAQDRSMYVYATIYKSKDGKSVAQQIDAAFSLA